MNKKKESKAWLSTFMCLTVMLTLAIMILFIMSNGLRTILSDDSAELFAYICYDIVVVFACFNILRKFPFSIWYVPILMNTIGIVLAIKEPDFWASPICMVLCIGWILSLITTFIGYRVGRLTEKENNS